MFKLVCDCGQLLLICDFSVLHTTSFLNRKAKRKIMSGEDSFVIVDENLTLVDSVESSRINTDKTPLESSSETCVKSNSSLSPQQENTLDHSEVVFSYLISSLSQKSKRNQAFIYRTEKQWECRSEIRPWIVRKTYRSTYPEHQNSSFEFKWRENWNWRYWMRENEFGERRITKKGRTWSSESEIPQCQTDAGIENVEKHVCITKRRNERTQSSGEVQFCICLIKIGNYLFYWFIHSVKYTSRILNWSVRHDRNRPSKLQLIYNRCYSEIIC